MDKTIKIKLPDYSVLEKVGNNNWKIIPNQQSPYLDKTIRDMATNEVLELLIDNLITKNMITIEITQLLTKVYYVNNDNDCG